MKYRPGGKLYVGRSWNGGGGSLGAAAPLCSHIRDIQDTRIGMHREFEKANLRKTGGALQP